jgi:hypothetical protein
MKTAINIGLWIVQVLLAALFLFQGIIKFAPPANLPEMLNWVYDLNKSSPALSTFIGSVELLAVAGLILPGLFRIQPRITIWAAFGLMTVMVLAAGYHVQRAEFSSIGGNVFAFVLSALVAYGRWRVVPLGNRDAKSAAAR